MYYKTSEAFVLYALGKGVVLFLHRSVNFSAEWNVGVVAHFTGLCAFDRERQAEYNDWDSVKATAISTYVLPVKRLEARPSVTLS